jgi:hypothetical protein
MPHIFFDLFSNTIYRFDSRKEKEKRKGRNKIMKKTKAKMFCLILALTLLVSIMPMANVFIASATQQDINQNKISSYEMIQNALSTMSFPGDVDINFGSAEADEKTVVIEFVGMSAYLSFDKSVDADKVVYDSSDTNVVFPDDGRFLALGAGEAVIQVTYEGVSEFIKVIVEKQFDQATLRSYLSESKAVISRAIDPNDPNYDARMAMINKASAMVSQVWRPTQDLVKWGPRYPSTEWSYFEEDEYQWGIPYTQVTQVDEATFLNKMAAADFYTPNQSVVTKTGEKVCPQYGSDCSGFVSFCWGIPRINTTEFNNRVNNGTYKKLSSNSQLCMGDAVVSTEKGHMFLIFNNFEVPPAGGTYTESYVACYEQTPPISVLSFHTYSQLVRDTYVPFSKFR